MGHVHTWDRGDALVCHCGETTPRIWEEIRRIRRSLLLETVDDAEIALLRQDSIPVTVAALARWGGWK